jgi:tRNA (guanine37-N1)-methyltransferase
MEVHIATLFPGMFQGPFAESMLGRAQKAGLLTVRLHDLRDYTHDRHRQADDTPYGGGPGMVLKPEPFFEAVDALRADIASRLGAQTAAAAPVLLPSARGRPFTQTVAAELAEQPCLILLCGHYEGVDARVEEVLATHCFSIGDYVLTGGELPAMVLVDAVARLLSGVLHDPQAAQDDSFGPQAGGLLQHPQYTRPASYRGLEVPEILLAGDHEAVARWRRRQALEHTWATRPDLLPRADLSPAERAYLEVLKQQKDDGG